MAQRLKMKDLVTRSGLSRATIHYYISEGLVPPPVAKSRNMAWYDESHLQRLLAIKDLQQTRFLPLKAIKAVLGESDSPTTLTQEQRALVTRLRSDLRARDWDESVTSEAVADVLGRTGLTEGDLEDLIEAGVVRTETVDDELRIPADDVTILEALARIRVVVTRPDGTWHAADWAKLNALALDLLNYEAELFATRFPDLDPERILETVDEVVPLINDVFGLLHLKHIRSFVNAASTGDDD